MTTQIQIEVLRSLHGQAVDSKTVKIDRTEKAIDSFAAEVTKDLGRGFWFRISNATGEVAFCKPMPADYIAAEIASF